ncbi:DUF3302 domain-containing protein [Achromobacter sp. JD417]|uniref:DUF3302 domain-containing protein n=1 Tax=Achromobacter sp. JD417 TaxID=2893881 RepID=UPI0035A59524
MHLSTLRSKLTSASIAPIALFPGLGRAASSHIEDAIADVLVWIVLVLVPVLAVWIFWKLHVLPEVIAEKRRHPQAEAIKALCLLSLAFGGMLWPFAWLWAYTKPVAYRLAYGVDEHDGDHPKPRAKEGEAEV